MLSSHDRFHHDTRTAMTVLIGRSQNLRRHVNRGSIDATMVLAHLDVIDVHLRRLIVLHDAWERLHRPEDTD